VKRCPTCNRSFDDDTLSFCLDDGTPLVRDPASRADSQETLVSPSPSSPPPASSALPPTQIYGQLPGKATVSASQFDLPPAAQPFVPAAKRRRTWPWVVGILAIFMLIVGLVVAAVVIPPMLRDAGNNNKPQPTPTRSDWTTTPTPIASPSEEADDVPEDDDEVLSQLTRIEEDWTRANAKGDKEALERILADEYVGGATTHTKREYIDSLTPDPSIKSWELTDLTVEQNDDQATVKGTLTLETTKGTDVSGFTDKFVWRDHRWQAVASHATRVK
jgi:hypothetical protein